MKKRSPFLILFALLALAAIVAGCGGGSDSTGSTGGSTEAQSGSTESDESGSAPTKAVFIEEADKICEEDDNEIEDEAKAYAEEHGFDLEKEPSEDQQEELFQEVALQNVARQGEEIAALTPPEGDEETVEDLTDTLADEVSEAEDAGGLPDEDTLKGATEKAQEYGLKACGS